MTVHCRTKLCLSMFTRISLKHLMRATTCLLRLRGCLLAILHILLKLLIDLFLKRMNLSEASVNSYRDASWSHRRNRFDVKLEGLCKPVIKTVLGYNHMLVCWDDTIEGRFLHEAVQNVVVARVLLIIQFIYRIGAAYIMKVRQRDGDFLIQFKWFIEIIKIILVK